MSVPAGVGSITLGEDFVSAANHLYESEVQFRHAGPVEYMFAHGLELLLKGSLLFDGMPENDVKAFKHRILDLYDKVRSKKLLETHISSAETHVRDQWRIRLQRARDSHEKNFRKAGLTDPDHLKEFGVYNNQAIGQELPEFRNQVSWLDERHKDEGGLFRYHQTRVDQRKKIQAFGLNDDVVLKSMSWGCQFLAHAFVEMTRAKSKV